MQAWMAAREGRYFSVEVEEVVRREEVSLEGAWASSYSRRRGWTMPEPR